LRTKASAAIAVLTLTLLSSLALAASPPSLTSRTIAYLPYPGQGLELVSLSPLPPYGILLLFEGPSGSYLAMFNISDRDYRVIAYFGSNIAPYLSPSAPMLCLSNLSNSTGIVYVAEVSPEGSVSEEPLINGSYVCTGLAEADGVIVASLLNATFKAMTGLASDRVVVARQAGGSLEVMRSASLPPGEVFADFFPSPSGLFYGLYLKYLFTPISNVYAIYPAYVSPSSGSLTVLNQFNRTLTLPSYEYLVLHSSMVSSSLIIYGGVYVTTSSGHQGIGYSAQPVLVYFNTSTYLLLNISDLMPPMTAVVGAYWSPWGILISDAQAAQLEGPGGAIEGVSYSSPQLFLAPWGGGLVNETGLAPGQLVLGGLEVKGSYYLVAVNMTGRKVAIIEVYRKGLSWAYVITSIVVIAIVSLAVLLRRR
jgi:hypothetical protein